MQQIDPRTTNIVLPCIKCGVRLKSMVAPHPSINQPHRGTTFESVGHYGSTAFDPMDGSSIEITVCDECLNAARDAGNVLYRKREVSLYLWNGSY